MATFDELCRQVEEMDGETYSRAMLNCLADILPQLDEIKMKNPLDGGTINGRSMLVNFVIATTFADGSFNEAEMGVIVATFKACFGDQYDEDYVMNVVAKYSESASALVDFTDAVIDIIGENDAELKSKIVFFCLLVCGVDSDVTDGEKAFLAKLLA